MNSKHTAGARPVDSGLAPFVIALALAVGGCAQLPELAQLSPMRTADQSATSFTAPAAQWPTDQWWTAYDDKQLDALIAEAFAGSPDLATAAAKLRQAEALGQVAGALMLPQVDGSASVSKQKMSNNYLTPVAFTPQGWPDYGLASLNLNWEIDFWGKHRAALAAATSEIDASKAELAQARLALAAGVASNYAQLAALFAERDTAARSVEIRRKTVTLFTERFENGLETQGSLNEAKARLASAQGNLLSVDESIGLQRNRLAALLGAGPDRGLRIERPRVSLAEGHGLPADLSANLLGRRPDVVAARLMVQAREKRIVSKKAEFYPNVNLSAAIGVQSLGLGMLTKAGSGMGSIGPALSLPIFTGGRLRGELRGTAAAYDQAVATYNATVTRALQDVADAWLSQKSLAAQLDKAQEAFAAAQEAYRVANNRYEGGLANYLEVLHAEDTLLDTQRALTSLQSRAFSLDIALTRALGGGYLRDPQTETHKANS
jgi:NodT family efflux transporter outer membrane factor (OMF) lipoprotein